MDLGSLLLIISLKFSIHSVYKLSVSNMLSIVINFGTILAEEI